jgi:glycosyltransferase involved in cell wall biosynthesis
MGGAERVALDLAVLQKRLGHKADVIVLSNGEGPLAGAFREEGVVAKPVEKRHGIDFSLPLRVAKQLRSSGADIVHTHNTLPLSYGALAGRLSRKVVVHSKHGEGHMVSKGAKALRRAGGTLVHRFVAVSEATAAHARTQRSYPFPSKIRVIENGIRMDRHRADAEARRVIRQELSIPQSAWVVGTVGRLDPNKNQSALVRALAPTLSKDHHLVVVGDGECMAEVQALAEGSANSESIHLLGRRNDVNRVMAALDVFALPSLSEGLPLVILEAMATGLPIVSSDVGGISKVLEHEAMGYLVEANDEQALASALQRLREQPEEARSMGNKGRAHVQENYSAETMAKRYLALYREALGP